MQRFRWCLSVTPVPGPRDLGPTPCRSSRGAGCRVEVRASSPRGRVMLPHRGTVTKALSRDHDAHDGQQPRRSLRDGHDAHEGVARSGKLHPSWRWAFVVKAPSSTRRIDRFFAHARRRQSVSFRRDSRPMSIPAFSAPPPTPPATPG